MFKASKAAQLHYDTPEFEVIVPGSHVFCAVSGERIELDDLKYWSAAFQEAYRSAEEATAAYQAGGAANLKK